MENLKFTKGKWRFSLDYPLITTSKKGVIEGSKTICDLNENVSFGDNEGEMLANAKLICAAPEMLDTCESVVKWWKEHQYDFAANDGDEYNVYDEEPEFVKKAKAAIKKATL